MFETDDVDEDYFTPSNNATLANIFNNPSNKSSENASLKYVPPKPSVSETKKPDESKTECLFACPLQAFEWFNNVYTPRGKVGFALVKMMNSGHSNILLYDSNKLTLSCATVAPSLEVKLKGETYLSYYDNAKKYWSLYGTHDEVKKIMKALENLNCVISISPLEDKAPPEQVAEQTTAQPTDDSTLKDSDTDSLTNRKTKESILNRMASMGHSVLPPQTISTDKTSDSSDTNETYEHHKVIRHKASKNMLKKSPDIMRSMTVSQIEPESNISLTEKQLVPALKADIVSSVGAVHDLSILMSEQRQNNGELRINMGRLTDKIDQLLEKVNNIQDNEKSSSEHSFQNTIYQKLLGEYENKIRTYEELMKSQRVSNEINMIASQSKQDVPDSKANYDEVVSLKAEILSLKNINKQKDLEVDRIRSEKEMLRVKLTEEIDMIRKQFEQDKLNLNREIETLKADLCNTEAEVVKLKKYCDILNKTKKGGEVSESADLKVRVKRIMNDTFQSIAVNFNNDENYLGSAVKTTTAAVIKEVTLETLQELNFNS